MRYFNDISHVSGSYDLIVGIPSYNNASTIGHVAQVAAKGIVDTGLRGAIVNSDGGSSDGTTDAFLRADTPGVEKFSLTYRGIPGKGSAVRALFEVAHKVGARVFVMLDSDLRSVEPWWIERLTKPILSGLTHYVTPLYLRHKYDGTITNNICYPLTAAFYGVKIRQPIGGDFGVSGDLLEIYLSKPEATWSSNVARFGIDIWMTSVAINETDKLPVQAALGAKVHDVKDPGKHLQGMFVQVVQTLFETLLSYSERWKSREAVVDTEIYGEQPSQRVEALNVDLENLKKRASQTVAERRARLEYLDEAIVKRVLETGTLDLENWVATVLSALLRYSAERSEEVVLDLLGFYFARVADFVERTSELDTPEAERLIDAGIELFREGKMRIKDFF